MGRFTHAALSFKFISRCDVPRWRFDGCSVEGHWDVRSPSIGRRRPRCSTPVRRSRLEPVRRRAAPRLNAKSPRDAEPVGDPLACEPSDDVVRDGQLLTHRMFPDNEIRLPPRIDRPADGQPGPDPDCGPRPAESCRNGGRTRRSGADARGRREPRPPLSRSFILSVATAHPAAGE